MPCKPARLEGGCAGCGGAVKNRYVEAMGRLVKGPFEGHVVGDLSHLLRPDPGPVGPRGYRCAVRQPVSPEVLDLITAWVTRHWGGPGGTTA